MITFTNATTDGPVHLLKPSEALFVLSVKLTMPPPQQGVTIDCTQIVLPAANLFVKEPIDQVLAALGVKPKKTAR